MLTSLPPQGGEVLCRSLRDVDDDFNTYIGSGLAAALLRYEDGPLGMLQGFAIGYGFMFAIERVSTAVSVLDIADI